MCGIAGITDFGKEPDKKIVSRMLGSISYRGPDQKGLYIRGNICMGIQRLSIIDLKTGSQPIENENGSVAVVFNGEIYNYGELTEDLKKRGHIFKTKSDTEVLVHLYEVYGENMTAKLNGMFAFAIWDKRKKLFFAGRDPAGIKPFYFFNQKGILVFASEIKAVLLHPLVKREINPQALQTYSRMGYVAGNLSIFKNINKLLPGCSLSFDKNGLKITRYHSVVSKENTDDIDQILEKAVMSQTMADVPLGVMLSGGIDSSLITYYLTKNIGRRINSFSIAFDEKTFDESEYALAVSKHFGTKHHQEKFTARDVKDLFPVILNKLDEPLADPSLLPTYKLCNFTRKYVKVALSGDGGDELFGGYPTYQGHLLSQKMSFFPKALSEQAAKFLHLFKASDGNYPKTEVLARFLEGLHKEDLARHFYWMSLGEKKLLRKEFLQKSSEPEQELRERLKEFKGTGSLRFQLIDFYSYLTDDLLVKTDRASMYNSLEVRVPFLDLNVISSAFSSKKHLDFFRTKKMLRKLLRKHLPPQIVERKKKGFGLPISKWLAGDLGSFAFDYLHNKKLYDFFDREKVMKLWELHQSRRQNCAKALWMLTVFSGWLNLWYS